MSIRLEAIETVGRGLKDWCKQTVPLFCVARFLSDRPIDWCLFWIGWKFLRYSSTTYIFKSTCSNKDNNTNDGINDDMNDDINDDDENVNDNNNCGDGDGDDNDNVVNHGGSRDDLSYSSATNFYTENHNGKNNNNDNNNNRSKNKISTLDKGSNNKSLTALPPVILSHVTCYLHPRDVLSLDSVFQCCSSIHIDIICHDIWKRLWYRDYGDVLLRWKVARTVFCTSLQLIPPLQAIKSDDDDDDDDSWLEEQLSNYLDKMMLTTTITKTATITMKEFYFVFGECYIDYLLANKNTIDECLLGLHGHIFDFTHFAEYHPGLIDPILKECGGDATYFFEDIPHSYGARNIARQLCVLVNRNVINYNNHSDGNINTNNSTSNINCSRSCGLELVLSPSSSSSSSLSSKDNNESKKKDILKLKRLLRSTNTRPPPPSLSTAYSPNNGKDKNNKMNNNNNSENRNWWMPYVLPRRRKLQRPPTLERIRNQFQQEKQLQEQQFHYDNNALDRLRLRSPSSSLFDVTTMTKVLSSSSLVRFWNSSFYNPESASLLMTRLYYDPFRQQWIRWDPNNPKL